MSNIEWKGIYGSVAGQKMFTLNCVMWPMWSNNWRVLFLDKLYECDTLEAAKSKCEDKLFPAWLKEAGLMPVPESCPKCDNIGRLKGGCFDWVADDGYSYNCSCQDNPNSVFNFFNSIKGG